MSLCTSCIHVGIPDEPVVDPMGDKVEEEDAIYEGTYRIAVSSCGDIHVLFKTRTSRSF